MYGTGRMRVDTLKHVHQIVIAIDAMRAASSQQSLYRGHVFGTDFRAAKHPVLFTHRYYTQRSLQVIGVQVHPGVCEKYTQPCLSLQRIVECLGNTNWTPILTKRKCDAVLIKLQ